MRIIVAGGRHFSNMKLLSEILDSFIKDLTTTTIVSGHARGADSLGECYAHRRNIPVEIFKAD